MTSPDHDVDPFIRALREDLPSGADERRIRARLLAAGIAVGTGLCASGAAAAGGATAAKVGFLPKLAALSWGTKVGLAGAALAAATAVPFAAQLASGEPLDEVRPTSPTSSEPLAPSRERPALAPPEASMANNDLDVEETGAAEAAPAAASPAAARSVTPRRLPKTRLSTPPSRAHVAPVRPAPALENVEASAAFPIIETTPEPPVPTDHGASPAVQAPLEVVPPSTLGEETAIMDRALSALRAGQRERALHWLGEHARRFPGGKLARERESAWAQARSLPEASGSTAQ